MSRAGSVPRVRGRHARRPTAGAPGSGRGARRRQGVDGVAVRGTISSPSGARPAAHCLRAGARAGLLRSTPGPVGGPGGAPVRSVPVRDPGDGYRRGPVVASDGPGRRTAVPRSGRRLPGGSAAARRGAVGGGRGGYRWSGTAGAAGFPPSEGRTRGGAGSVGRSGDPRGSASRPPERTVAGCRSREALRGTASAAGARTRGRESVRVRVAAHGPEGAAGRHATGPERKPGLLRAEPHPARFSVRGQAAVPARAGRAGRPPGRGGGQPAGGPGPDGAPRRGKAPRAGPWGCSAAR